MKLPGFMQFTPHERKAVLALLLFTGGGGLLIEAGRRFPVYFPGLLPAGGSGGSGASSPDSIPAEPAPAIATVPDSAADPPVETADPESGVLSLSGVSGVDKPGASVRPGGAERRSRGAAPSVSFPIDINGADENTLTALPGIGPRLAARITADRSANGPFRSVDDLSRVKGIGPATVNRLRPMITIG